MADKEAPEQQSEEPAPEQQTDTPFDPTDGALENVEGEPSSSEVSGDDPAGQVAETFPGSSPDPQATSER